MSGQLVVLLAFFVFGDFTIGRVSGTSSATCVDCQRVKNVKQQLNQIKNAFDEFSELLQNTTATCPNEYPKDCSGVFANGMTTSGVYTVQPVVGDGPIDVYCDMETDGGGWTVFQRRQDGSVDFYRDWESYRQGFGDLNGEFWLGNDNLHRLTAQGVYRLRIDLEDFENNTAYAVYDTFRVADGSANYRLTVEGYSGTAGDALSYHSNQSFTTKDRDKDSNGPYNCAVKYSGAWWYKSCHHSNLNGMYLGGQTSVYAKGVVWYHWKGHNYSLKRTEMKIRSKI
ncbi:microfibril-associated glycoprotein 4-like [Acanthaster planci]|uniref:Microfibril-associated glycoprotein 4-like n=1 Tax=Acanthaster planci TaxID=133434 RepID=A0A8B7ZRD1_ACAPL|nr:microfibril-associated glycoprotein 4-like [Acanthaster planci]XP_022107441.1 microfibril-associated glycoprotein 4-like [Acanthaster planci]